MATPQLLPADNPTNNHRPWALIFAVAITLCMLGGVAVRLWAARDFLWLDELHTAWAVSGTFSNVSARAVDGNQTPLYFWLTFAALKTFGTSTLALRSVSILASVALVILLPIGVHRITRSNAAAFLVSLFLLADYDMVFYASEARPYALVQLLGVLQAVAFWGWVDHYLIASATPATAEKNTSRLSLPLPLRLACHWSTVSILSALLIYTHITGAWLLLAEVIFVLSVCAVRRTIPARQFWWAAGLFLVLVIPAAITVTTAWSRKGNWSSVSNSAQVESGFWRSCLLFAAIPLAALLIERLVLWIRPSQPSTGNPRSSASLKSTALWQLFFVTLWAIVPTLAIVLLDRFQIAPLALGRYAIVGAVAFVLTAAWLIGRIETKGLQWTVAAVIVAIAMWHSPTIPALLAGGLRNENWRDAIATIASEPTEAATAFPILLAANLLEDVEAQRDASPRFQNYLKFPVLGAAPALDNPVVPLNSRGPLCAPEAAAMVRRRGGGWLIVRDLPESVPQIIDEINACPDAAGFRFEHAHFDQPSPNYVQLFRIRPR